MFPSAGFDIENVGNPARAFGLGILLRIASSAGRKCFVNERIHRYVNPWVHTTELKL